jgi:uncharacterized protein with PIN domain
MSPLPLFEVEQVEFDTEDGSSSAYAVTCPRCGGEFWVRLGWARLVAVEGAGGQLSFPSGRPCPNCS